MSISADGLEDFNKLAEAIKRGDVKTCKELIERGVNLNYPYYEEGSLLHLALKKHNIEVAELLLEKGIDPSIKNGNGYNFVAYLAGHYDYGPIKGSFSRLWKKLNPEVALKCLQEYDKYGRAPLHLAAYGGLNNIQVLTELIELIPVEEWLPIFYQKTREASPNNVFESLVISNNYKALKIVFEKMNKGHKEEKLKLILEGEGESLLNLIANKIISYNPGLYFTMNVLLKEIPDKKVRKDFVLNPNDIMNGILYKFYIGKEWDKLNEILEACGLLKITGIDKTNEEILAILSKDEYFPELLKVHESKEHFIERVKATTANELFTSGDVAALTKKFKDTWSETREDPLLLYGPLVKTQHTVDLEKIAKYILQGKKFSIVNSSGVCLVKVVLEDRKESYNLTEIMKFANLQHVVLNKEDMERYAEFIKTTSQIKPGLEGSSGIPTEENFNEKDKEGSLRDLSYSEKMALNIWTGVGNEPMWDLLNGNFEEISKGGRNPSEILVHCVMAASGMNKIPNTTIHYAYRWEKADSEFSLKRKEKRITAAGKGGILMERSFVSTSYTKPAEAFNPGKNKVGLFFSEGIIGKDISVISQYPAEREFLLPPVQVQFLEHIHEKGKDGRDMDFFKCKTVRTLTSLPEEAQIAAESIPEEELERLKAELSIFQTSIVDLEAELKKKNYDPKFITLINNLNTTTERLMNLTDMGVHEKLSNISNQLNKTIEEIESSTLSLDEKIQEESETLNKILKHKESELKTHHKSIPKPAQPITFYSKHVAGGAQDKEKDIVKEAQKFNDPKTSLDEMDALKKELGLRVADEVLKVEDNRIQVKHPDKEVKWHDIQSLYDEEVKQRKSRPE